MQYCLNRWLSMTKYKGFHPESIPFSYQEFSAKVYHITYFTAFQM